jgi:hypothetical protein
MASETKKCAEVSIEWLKEIYSSLDYETDEIKTTSNSKTFNGIHKANPNLFVELRPSLRVILITSNWNIKAPNL